MTSRDTKQHKLQRMGAYNTVTAILDTRPQFESVEGTETKVLVDGTRRKSGTRQFPAATSTLHQRGKKSDGCSPIQFQDGYLNHPGLFSVELGFSTASMSYERQPSTSVVVPLRCKNNYLLTDTEEAELITLLEKEYPECQGKLTKSISASYDSESFLSQNCSSFFSEALRPSIDTHSLREAQDSIFLSNSMNSMFHAVSQDHTKISLSSMENEDISRDSRAATGSSTTVIYNGRRGKTQTAALPQRQHKVTKPLQ